jgi:hypothetical protein
MTTPRFNYGPRPLKGRKGMTKKSYWNEVLPTKPDGKANPAYSSAPYGATVWWMKVAK